jgi:hypothetical protein
MGMPTAGDSSVPPLPPPPPPSPQNPAPPITHLTSSTAASSTGCTTRSTSSWAIPGQAVTACPTRLSGRGKGSAGRASATRTTARLFFTYAGTCDQQHSPDGGCVTQTACAAACLDGDAMACMPFCAVLRPLSVPGALPTRAPHLR